MDLLIEFILLGTGVAAVSWVATERFQASVMAMSSLLAFAYIDWVSAVLLFSLSLLGYFLLLKKSLKAIWITIISLIVLFVIVKIDKSFEYNYTNNRLALVGFSFYMFRLIHLSIESYKGLINRELSLVNWMNYLVFFPVLIIGPINRIADFEREMRRRRLDTNLISIGVERMLYGLVKIVFFGNYICGIVIELVLDSEHLTQGSWLYAYIDCFRYGMNSYFQFAGYTDIAIGMAALIGVRVGENFNFPFLAKSMGDFWKRWHISLSQWCRDYVFMPIASFTRRPFFGIIVSMLILGLWHEFTWRYVLWALIHGLGIIIWDIGAEKIGSKINNRRLVNITSGILTFNFVILSFGVIKDTSIQDTINTLKILLLIS